MSLHRAFPLKNSEIRSCTLGMRVDPPTMTISLIIDFERPLSAKHCVTGSIAFLK